MTEHPVSHVLENGRLSTPAVTVVRVTPWEAIQAALSTLGTIGGGAATTIYTRFRATEKRARLALQRAEEARRIAEEVRALVTAAEASLREDVPAWVTEAVNETLKTQELGPYRSADARQRLLPPMETSDDVRVIVQRELRDGDGARLILEDRIRMLIEAHLRNLVDTHVRAIVDRRFEERSRSMSPSVGTYAVRPDRSSVEEMMRGLYNDVIKPGIKLEWRKFLDDAETEIDARVDGQVKRLLRNSQADDQSPQLTHRLERLERRFDALEEEFRTDTRTRTAEWNEFRNLAAEMRILLRNRR